MSALPKWTVHYNIAPRTTDGWIGSGWEFFDDERDAQECYDRRRAAGDCPTKRPYHDSVDGPHLHVLQQDGRPRRDPVDMRQLPPLTAMCSCTHPYMAHVSLEFVNHSLQCLEKGCGCERFEWVKAAAVENLLARLGPRQFRLEYDSDYGIDHRSGWSVVVDGIVVVQFAETPEIALRQAVERVADREASRG